MAGPEPVKPSLTTKHDTVVAQLRRMIVDGTHGPGDRLPTRTDLAKRFGVSRQTVQNAFDELTAEGFVVPRGRLGTFVTETPPHLGHYALVFPRDPLTDVGWPQFWTAVFNEAQALKRAKKARFSVFYGTSPAGDQHSYATLAELAASHRVAGLIFVTAEAAIASAGLEEAGIPRVAIAAEKLPGLSAVNVNATSFYEKALGYLAQRGRKRVSLLLPNMSRESLSWVAILVRTRLEQLGMATRVYWIQAVDPLHPHWARRLVELLLRTPPEERPDSLIIADDDLAEDAAIGIQSAGVHVPGDLEIIAHASFPWITPCDIPAVRLGFDVREVLRICTENIDRQQRGEAPPVITHVEARFENDLT